MTQLVSTRKVVCISANPEVGNPDQLGPSTKHFPTVMYSIFLWLKFFLQFSNTE